MTDKVGLTSLGVNNSTSSSELALVKLVPRESGVWRRPNIELDACAQAGLGLN